MARFEWKTTPAPKDRLIQIFSKTVKDLTGEVWGWSPALRCWVSVDKQRKFDGNPDAWREQDEWDYGYGN